MEAMTYDTKEVDGSTMIVFFDGKQENGILLEKSMQVTLVVRLLEEAGYSKYTGLSKAALERYLESGGNHCPHCGSSNIFADHPETHEAQSRSRVECRACEKEWIDVFTLSGVEKA